VFTSKITLGKKERHIENQQEMNSEKGVKIHFGGGDGGSELGEARGYTNCGGGRMFS